MVLYEARRMVLLLLSLVVLTLGCSRGGTAVVVDKHDPPVDAEEPAPQGLADPKLTAPLSEGINEFACDLYREVAQGSDGNLVFSPFSVHMALAMVHAGARGATREAMTSTLCVAPDFDLAAAYGSLTRALPLREVGYQPDDRRAGEPELLVANGIWSQDGFRYRPEYLEAVGPAYDPELRTADFWGAPEAAAADINAWVSEKTRAKIRHIADPRAIQDMVMVLVNAIYFKGAWSDPFHEGSTAPAPFRLAGGASVDVPTMHGGMEGGYARGDGWTSFSMPYEGGNLEMVVILPDGDLAKAESDLTAAQLGEVLGALEARDLLLWLPKFRFEVTLPLTEVLKALGLGIAFDPGAADLSGIAEGAGLFISDVLHKAMIDVNEHGTEAAAATLVAIAAAAKPEPPVEIRVDRPFLFLIHDRATESILFMGRVMDPR